MNEQTIERITQEVMQGWDHKDCVVLVRPKATLGGTEEGLEYIPTWNVHVSCQNGSDVFEVETPRGQSEQKTKELIAQGLRKHLGNK